MSLEIKFVPLTFIKSNEDILRQIKNTVCFSSLFNQVEETTFSHYIESSQYGYTASANQTGTHRLLRITDINNGDVEWENVPFCNCESEEKYLLKDNDILIARTGGTTGKSFIASNVPSNAIFASYLIRLRLKKDVNINFINGFLNSYTFWSQIIEMKSGSAMPNVNAEKLKILKIPKCDIATQNKTADIIKEPGNLVGNVYLKEKIRLVEEVFNKGNNITTELTQQLHLVKKLRQQLLQDAVQGKLVEQNPNDEPASVLLQKIKAEKEQLVKYKKLKKEKELPQIKPEEIPFGIPENWVWSRLGDAIELVSGQDLTPNEYSDSDSRGIPYITGASNLQDGDVIINRWTNVPKSHSIAGDLLLTCKGSGVGKMAYLKSGKVHIARQIMAIRSSFIPLNYAELILLLNVDYFKKNAKSLIPGIDRSQVLNLLLPLPPKSEQNRIVQKLMYLMQTCDALEASIKQSQQQNEQLLQQVLREALTKKVEPEAKDLEKYKSLLLAAEIIWQLNQKQTLGHIKLQKLVYLSNRTLQMNLPVNFLKRAMGPYDSELQQYIDAELIARQWFSYNEDDPLKYRPLTNAGGHKADFDKYFGEYSNGINHLIHLFEDARSAMIEIVATLYWCWDEMLTGKQLVNDTALLTNFYAFSDKKKKFQQDKVVNAIRWMEAQGIIPN